MQPAELRFRLTDEMPERIEPPNSATRLSRTANPRWKLSSSKDAVTLAAPASPSSRTTHVRTGNLVRKGDGFSSPLAAAWNDGGLIERSRDLNSARLEISHKVSRTVSARVISCSANPASSSVRAAKYNEHPNRGTSDRLTRALMPPDGAPNGGSRCFPRRPDL
jgi:hypothetical protein